MTIKAKICGLTTPEAVDAAVEGGAAFLGAVFFPPSPRNLTAEQAQSLLMGTPETCKKVAVMVDPSDADLTTILAHFTPDYLQLHGEESPERTQEIKQHTNLPIIKALPVRKSDDVARAGEYETIADMLLFDAKEPSSTLPGGNGLAFDWQLLKGRHFSLPWMLSGGLNANNVAEAVRISGAAMVDASSSLERTPGVKDPALITAFLNATSTIDTHNGIQAA